MHHHSQTPKTSISEVALSPVVPNLALQSSGILLMRSQKSPTGKLRAQTLRYFHQRFSIIDHHYLWLWSLGILLMHSHMCPTRKPWARTLCSSCQRFLRICHRCLRLQRSWILLMHSQKYSTRKPWAWTLCSSHQRFPRIRRRSLRPWGSGKAFDIQNVYSPLRPRSSKIWIWLCFFYRD